MNKLVITKWRGQILSAGFRDGSCRTLNLEPADSGCPVGSICIAKVKNVVRNLNAAFLDLGGGHTGYYSLAENKEHFYPDVIRAAESGLLSDTFSDRKPKQGDELVVQVKTDALKTKDPQVTSHLNFTGTYAVLTAESRPMGFSLKIRDDAKKAEIREYLESRPDLSGARSMGIIIRTHAADVSPEAVGDEIALLYRQYTDLLQAAACRVCFSVLRRPEPAFLQMVRDGREGTDEICTDIPEYHQMIRDYLEKNGETTERLSLYEDELLPLTALCGLEHILQEASGRRVWLKSGGYLIIEPTEALTVIDVNTGRYAGRRNVSETILKINLEAAIECARQICLRSLSGIIIIDFIDMEEESHVKQLMDTLQRELSKDPVKTVLVDITRLGLVEITRKKVRRPLHELLRTADGNEKEKHEKN